MLFSARSRHHERLSRKLTKSLKARIKKLLRDCAQRYISGLGDLVKAEEQLEALELLCLIPFEEYGDLQRAIRSYKKTEGR
jgi:hypothetical protein